MPRTERRRAAATSAVFGLLAALALPAAAAPSVGLGALVTDEPDFQPYYATVAARHAARARAGTVEAAAPKSTYVVRVEGPIAGSTTATRAALAGLGPSCEVLGTVAYLQGHYVVECSGSVARRDALAAPGIADVELQVPMQRLFKRKGIPPKNPGYDSLSDEWKEELRGRIEEDDRQREEANAAQGSALEKRSQLEKRTVYTLPQVDAIWAKLGIKDPFVKRQWHIYNNVTPSSDLNVTGVWADGIRGSGSVVSIIDDGLDSTNPDLVDNFYLEGSWDFNDPAQAPSPQPQSVEDSHGTRCAGEVAAGKNTACGLGVAYEAKVSGVRILSGPLTNADEAAATNYEYQKNQIYSCSWGPPDDGASVDRPTSLSQKSYIEAVTNGRGGKGSIYVFAAGNGGENYDQCNYDGFINQIYTIGIGAIDWKDAHPSYSESCTALNAVTYSSSTSYGPAIYTSDAMPNQCTSSHTGTSAAAPLAAGIFALVLQANPDITWRDAQQLIYDTAIVVNPADPSWESMASGRKFSSKFGFGRLDAYAMVEAAKKFVSLPPQTSLPYVGKTVNKGIPHGNTGISDTITITQAMVTAANLASMEHLQVFLTVTHPSRGQMKYEIVSPSGIRSLLGDTRPYDTSSQGLTNWTFMSLKHWGESPVGDWTFTIKDPVDASRVGNIVSWGVKIWGAQPGGAQPATSFRPSASGITKKTATTSTKATATATGTVDNSVEQTSTASQASQTINLTTPIFVTTTSTSSRPNSAPRTGRARMMALVAGFLGAALAVAI